MNALLVTVRVVPGAVVALIGGPPLAAGLRRSIPPTFTF